MSLLLPPTLFAQTPGSTATTFAPQLAKEDPNPFNAGGIVFFVVVAIILIGALVLYLRNRRPAQPVTPR